MTKRDWSIRTVYLYLVSFVTLIMIILGTVNVIRAAVTFFYPQPNWYGPLDARLRYLNELNQYKDMNPKITEKITETTIEEQLQFEQQRQEKQQRYDRARQLAQALSLLLVATPIYLYHWRQIQREAVPSES